MLRDQFSGLKRANTMQLLTAAKTHQRSSSLTHTPALPLADYGSAEDGNNAYDGNNKMHKMRVQVIAEIFRTEEDYVRDLVFTVDYYLHPLLGSKSELKLTESDVRAIFGSFENIIPVNRAVLDRFKEVNALPFEQQSVGAVFSSLGDYLLISSD